MCAYKASRILRCDIQGSLGFLIPNTANTWFWFVMVAWFDRITGHPNTFHCIVCMWEDKDTKRLLSIGVCAYGIVGYICSIHRIQYGRGGVARVTCQRLRCPGCRFSLDSSCFAGRQTGSSSCSWETKDSVHSRWTRVGYTCGQVEGLQVGGHIVCQSEM